MASTPNDFFSGMRESILAAKAKVGSAYNRVASTFGLGTPPAQPGTAATDVQPRMTPAAELVPEAKVGAFETLPGNSQIVKDRLAAATARPLNSIEGSDYSPGKTGDVAGESPKGQTTTKPVMTSGTTTPAKPVDLGTGSNPQAIAGEGAGTFQGAPKQVDLPGASGGIRNPNVGPGKPSAEAEAFRASRVASAGGTTPNPTAPASGAISRGLRGLGGFAMKGAGIAGVASLVGPPAVAANDELSRSGLRSGVLYAAGPQFDSDRTTIDQGMKAAPETVSYDGSGEVNPKGAAPAVAAPGGGANTAVPGGEQAKAAGAPQNSGGGIPTLRGASVSPESLIAGNDVPQAGYGAFKRSTPMKAEGGMMEQPAVAIHAPGNETDEAANARHAAGLSGTARPGTASGGAGGVGGAVAKLYEAGAQGRAAALNRDYQLKAGSQRIAMMQLQNKLQQEGRERNNATIDALATSKMDASGTTTNDKDYGRNLEREKATHRDEFVYSASQRDDKRNFGDLNDQEVQQLADLKKLKDNVEGGRSSITAGLRDWFGISRTNSRNLYSYAPKIKETASLPGSGGTVFTLANGNKVTAVAAKGGGFNFLGPNQAVDADIDRMMNAAVEQYQTKGKK